MLVGIRIELLQPGFDLFHQPIFGIAKLPQASPPPSQPYNASPNQIAGMARRPIQPKDHCIAFCEARS